MRQVNQRSPGNQPTAPTLRPTSTAPPQANTVANQTVQQVSQGNVNSNTFVTQEEEIQQPTATIWEGIQHLN